MKIPVKRVASDDCLVHVGRKVEDGKIVDDGTAYAIHEGEWVELVPVTSMRQYIEITHLSRALQTQDIDGMESSMNNLCRALATRITAWSWTDLKGNPLPKPSEETIRDLTEDELAYLIVAVQGETPGERKNGSAPLPTKS